MTSLFTARRRAEEFATALDGHRVEESRYAGNAELVSVATMLREHAPAAPRPEFTRELRSRLMAEAETALTPTNTALLLPPRTHGARERRLVAAASAVVLIGGTASMAAAAQDALPGEMLYPIKRGIERAETQLNLSQAGKGRDLLHQASDRLAEVAGLVSRDTPASSLQVSDTLAAFTEQADEGAQVLLADFEETGDVGSIRLVRSFAAEGVSSLEDLAGDVPNDARDELSAAAIALRDIDEQARAVCGACADLPGLEVPGIFLARAEVDRALRLAADGSLDNSHPVVVDRRGEDPVESAGSKAGDGTQAGHSERDDAGQGTGGDTGQDTGQGSVGSDTGDGAGEPVADPTAPAPGAGLVPPDLSVEDLPDVKANVSGDEPETERDGSLGDAADETVEDLGEAVETLLPDPDPGDLLP